MPLVLDLLRHGSAALYDPGGDAARPLTARGARDLQDLGERLAREGWRPDRVFTSALLRAIDSARIVTVAAGVDPPSERLAELAPEGTPSGVIEALEARGVTTGHVLLVGHQPLLGDLAATLGGRGIPFPAGGLARIELRAGLRDGPGDILRIIDPDGAG